MRNKISKPVTCATSLSELIDKLLKILEKHGDMTVALQVKEPGFGINYRTDADDIRVKVDSSWNDPNLKACVISNKLENP